MNKDQAREHIKRALAGINADSQARKNRLIREALLELPEFAAADVVMLFASMPDEADTIGIIRATLHAGKTIVLPRVLKDQQRMVACPVHDLERDLVPGVFGILEPHTPPAEVASIDFCLVPARAFDTRGWRLGRGGGYYDRFMADPAFRATCCGIAFSEQILPSVPCQPHDLPVHLIVTDEGVIRVNQQPHNRPC